jgi:hypothetical protein
MSRFVSAGELEKQPKRDGEWVKAQQEVEESRKRKAEASRLASGKSLYEVLQDNKGVCSNSPSRAGKCGPGNLKLIT